MIIWMEVTKDEYELPIAVADTAQELAKMCGTTANNVMSSASHHKRGSGKTKRFRKVEIEGDEDTEGINDWPHRQTNGD